MYEKWSAGLDFSVPILRRVLVPRATATADRAWPHAAGRLPSRPAGAPTGHAQREDRTLLRDDRRLRLRRLRRPSDMVRTGRVARRRSRAALPAAPARQPARHATAQSARRRRNQFGSRKCKGANRSGCIRPMPPNVAWPTETSSGCSTTAARAWRASSSTIGCVARSCSSRRAPGTTPRTLAIPMRCACTAIRTC